MKKLFDLIEFNIFKLFSSFKVVALVLIETSITSFSFAILINLSIAGFNKGSPRQFNLIEGTCNSFTSSLF